VVHTLRQRFDVAEQHGRVGRDAERVGDAVDLAPTVRVGLAGVGEGLATRREKISAPRRQGVGPAAFRRWSVSLGSIFQRRRQ